MVALALQFRDEFIEFSYPVVEVPAEASADEDHGRRLCGELERCPRPYRAMTAAAAQALAERLDAQRVRVEERPGKLDQLLHVVGVRTDEQGSVVQQEHARNGHVAGQARSAGERQYQREPLDEGVDVDLQALGRALEQGVHRRCSGTRMNDRTSSHSPGRGYPLAALD